MAETLPDQPLVPQYPAADGKPLYPEQTPEDRDIAHWQENSPYFVPPGDAKHPHIVDTLIKERAVKLSKSRLWPLYRHFFNWLLNYKAAKKMVDTAGRWRAKEAFGYASGLLNMTLDVEGLEHLPRDGAFILTMNHPTGIADGLAVHDAIVDVRSDAIVFVNGDALRLNPLLTDKLIPVEWREDKKTRAKSRETLKASNAAFEGGRAIILFPAGRLAYMDKDKVLHERVWQTTVAALAKRYKVPVVPANIKSRNSWLYYWLWNVNEELRDMTLFHELLNKAGKTFRIRIQKPIPYTDILKDNDEAAAEMRAYCVRGIDEGLSFDEWREKDGTYDIHEGIPEKSSPKTPDCV
ncbi:lysophospholipid acyltransferase family protein [Parvularcula marina]|uniref:lysophospholipid acyltransferase family protein n=1 Tax=Parvularcula marina TaxID=2292771 RepID=UPI003511F1F8